LFIFLVGTFDLIPERFLVVFLGTKLWLIVSLVFLGKYISTAAKGGKDGDTVVPRNLPRESRAFILLGGTFNLIPEGFLLVFPGTN